MPVSISTLYDVAVYDVALYDAPEGRLTGLGVTEFVVTAQVVRPAAQYDTALYDTDRYDDPLGELAWSGRTTLTLTAITVVGGAATTVTRTLPLVRVAIATTETRVLASLAAAIGRDVTGAMTVLAIASGTVAGVSPVTADLETYALIQVTRETDLTTTGVLQVTQTRETTGDALVLDLLALVTDAMIAGPTEYDLVTQALIQVERWIGVETAGVVLETMELSLTTTGLIQQRNRERELATDAYISFAYAPVGADVVATGVVQVAELRQLSADAELIFEGYLSGLAPGRSVHAWAVIAPAVYAIQADAYVITFDMLWAGLTVVNASAVILALDQTRDIATSAVIGIVRQVVTRDVDASGQVVTSTTFVLRGVAIAVSYSAGLPYFDGKFYTSSSNSFVNGLTSEPIEVSVVGRVADVRADTLVAIDSVLVTATAVILVADRTGEVIATANVSGQSRRTAPMSMLVSAYPGAPRDLAATAVISSVMVFPVPSSSRLI